MPLNLSLNILPNTHGASPRDFFESMAIANFLSPRPTKPTQAATYHGEYTAAKQQGFDPVASLTVAQGIALGTTRQVFTDKGWLIAP